MDGQLSRAHRSRDLLDLIDSAWLQDSLSDDDLYLPATHEPPAVSNPNAESDESSRNVLTDGQGTTWSLTFTGRVTKQASIVAAATAEADKVMPIAGLMGGASGAGASSSGAAGRGNGASGSNSYAIESSDGMKWTDLALQGLARDAARQPPN